MANFTLDSGDTGSNYNFQDKIVTPNFPRSLFNLSHTNTTDIPFPTALLPVLCLEVVPTDSLQISCDALLRSLPSVVPLYSKSRLTLHLFHSDLSDLWTGANTFFTKGYNGNTILKMPTLTSDFVPQMADPNATVQPNDFLHYLYHLPIGTKYKDYEGKLSALPAFMAWSIWINYYANKNYYINDRVLLPDVYDDFRISFDGSQVISDPNHTLDFSKWLYRDYAPDRFNSAFPTTQRGDTPRIDIDFNFDNTFAKLVGINNGVTIIDGVQYTHNNDDSDGSRFDLTANGSTKFVYSIKPSFTSVSSQNSNIQAFRKSNAPTGSTLTLGIDLNGITASSSITLEQLRKLSIEQTELEKMARTDGTFGDFGLTFFGVQSKNATDFKPRYLGGTVTPVNFTEVVQTSQTTSDSALGQYAGHSVQRDQSFLGQVNANDYGFIMVFASIMPDTYYTQGIDKQFTRLYQSEFLLPERAKLGMQPILNKEIYFQGNAQDDELFAYQDIFDEMRYLPNRVHGKLADPTNASFYPYTQSRHFTSLPTYSQSFATTENNVRYDYLASDEEVPFTADFTFTIRGVRPLPYRAVPASLI